MPDYLAAYLNLGVAALKVITGDFKVFIATCFHNIR